jgi:hypothetical protein
MERVELKIEGMYQMQDRSARFLKLMTQQEVPKLFSQQELHGLVDKTMAQNSTFSSSRPTAGKDLDIKKFSLKIPWPHNSSGSSKIKIILSTRTS